MKASTRRAALRFAQKTALVASLGGCYESHALAPVDAAAGRPDTPPLADAPVRPDAPFDCDALARAAITVPEPTPDGWAWGAVFSDPALRTDPAVGACCVAMDERVGIDPTGGEVGTPLAMACCQVIVEAQNLVPFSNLGCTPWGPPCPPEMPEDAPELLA